MLRTATLRPAPVCTSGWPHATTLNIRGEIIQDDTAPTRPTGPNTQTKGYQSADGFVSGSMAIACSDTFDSRNGMLFYKAQTTDNYAYDAAGRQTQTTNPSVSGYKNLSMSRAPMTRKITSSRKRTSTGNFLFAYKCKCAMVPMPTDSQGILRLQRARR